MERRSVVITGVGRGLGLALATELASRGHVVLGCTRDPARARRVAEQLGDPHRVDTVDVADCDAVTSWGRALLEERGPPDIVINNAALMNDVRPTWEVPPGEFARLLQVNVAGVFHVMRVFLPAMNARGMGVVVNMSSGWGRSTDAGVAPYCASKWAVEGLSQAAAQEVARGVAVVALNPGIINTDMLRQCWASEAADYPGAEAWAPGAVDLLLMLDATDNGASRDVDA